MARVTVEDCIERVSNRFELVMVAAQRSRDIARGAPLTIDRDNDKNPVVSLREIADETVSVSELNEALILGLQRHVETDEPEEEDILDFLKSETTQPGTAPETDVQIAGSGSTEGLAETVDEGEAVSDTAETESES